MAQTINKPIVQGTDKYKAFYEERSALFGLIKWHVKIHEEKLGSDLDIYSTEKYDNIYLNGKLINSQG